MAVLDGPLYGTDAHGRVKTTLTYFTRQEWSRTDPVRRRHNAGAPSQELRRSAFKQACIDWNNLTPEEKQAYKDLATGMLTGFNLFIQEELTP